MSGTGTHCVVEPLRRLASAVADHLRSAPLELSADRELADRFATALEEVAGQDGGTVQHGSPRPVRGLAQLPAVLDRAERLGEWPLLDAAAGAVGVVRWSEFYAEDDWSRPFLADFANGEGIGPDGRIRDERVILGLFLLGPHAVYPPHAHPAEEFYVPVAGNVEFEVGAGSGYRAIPPGGVVLHHSNVSHSIRTGAEPSLSVFGWTGDLTAPSWYRADMADDTEPARHPTILKD